MSWHRGTYTVPKKEPKQKTASEAVASWVIVDVAWRISVLRHVTLMEVLQNKLPHENKSIKSVELTEGATMSFAVVVPPTAPAKRWRSEMELPKSRAGNEHICNRSTSAQHLFLARGLFAGWRDSIEIAHALTSPKTSEDSFKGESLISLLLSLVRSQFPYVCLLLSCSDVWCASYIAQAAVTRSGGSNCQWKHYLSEQWTCVYPR